MIIKPTFLIDEAKSRENIKKMYSKARSHHLQLRPHFKTHQSLEIGQWFKDAGVNKITVSSLSMAEHFSSEWDNITVAFPVNILEIEIINRVAERITLNLLAESVEAVTLLADKLKDKVGLFIKIDLGTHRTGIDPENKTLIDEILKIIDNTPAINFEGFLGHAGHSYACRTKKDVLKVHNHSLELMVNLKAHYKSQYPNLIISLGDTPTCSLADDFKGVDEIRPGNFVFYDLMQEQIGSCNMSQIAVAVACPIVAIHPERRELVIYGGGIHFSKESLEDEQYGKIYGKVVSNKVEKWGEPIQGMYLKKVSQEHGIISVPITLIESYKPGDILTVLPVHSCMTANLMKDDTIII